MANFRLLFKLHTHMARDAIINDGHGRDKVGKIYSVFLRPPSMVGLVSPAHFASAEKILPIPVSFGFSKPLMARCFITDTNSLFESF